MRSLNADRFNHDDEAPGYDQDVLDESNPIRAGYEGVLSWVAEAAGSGRSFLEFGAGTGNLTARLKAKEILCVEVSNEMKAIAEKKLLKSNSGGQARWIVSDLLEYFDQPLPEPLFDAAVSTYTLHHLLEEERAVFFNRLGTVLRPSGWAIFGDLMFESQAMRAEILSRYRDQGQAELADEIEEEFFWDLPRSLDSLKRAGFRVRQQDVKQFSELSWCVRAQRVP